jgi:glycosyltransferase involved in cell wall biosynthesis
MKIAHISATFPPYRAGTGNVCFHNARELGRLGHELHVFTAEVPEAPLRERRDGFTVHRLRPLVQVGNAPLLPQLLSLLRGFDLLHLHYPFIFGAELVRLASLLYRIPLVLSFHNDLIGDGIRAWLFAAYQRLSARLTVRGASCLCAVSLDHYQSSILRKSLTVKKPLVVPLPNGVDTECFSLSHNQRAADIRERLTIPAAANLVLFVAALDRAHYFKGLGRLLRAFCALPSDTWLLVVGDGELRASYLKQAQALGIAQRTVFVGAVNHEELPPFYRTADVTVLPSSPPESFGLVLIESLACGTPVVASNIPGVRTVVTHQKDGFLVRHGDIADLAGKLKRLLSFSESQRSSMGLFGRSKVEQNYSWSTVGARLEAIYEQVLSARQALGSVEVPL